MEERKHILVVDDEVNVRESLKLILSRLYDVSTAEDTENALTIVEKNSFNFDLVLVDLLMPGIDGLGLLKKLKSSHPDLPVIMLTAQSGVRSAVDAMKIGAIDYLNKPYDVDDLLQRIEDSLLVARPKSAGFSHRLNRPGLPESQGDYGALVGKHPSMQMLFENIKRVAGSDVTVLITGESGSGKELVSKEIHRNSSRASGPFIALNCAAIPESMIESELFGHEKGAFSGASEKRVGHFELADGGTLFLDEIGELSSAVQSKILRFLQDQQFNPLGSSQPKKVNVRIVAATNSSLDMAVAEGKFRKDLFYRINVVNISVPTLRERKEDISALLTHFINRFSSLYGRKITLEEKTLEILMRYSWPGNVRELENVTESLLALYTEESIAPGHLPSRIREEAGGDLKADVLTGEIGFEEAEKVFETELILKALERTGWVQTRAAELLGISRRILKYKMDKLGIPDKAPE